MRLVAYVDHNDSPPPIGARLVPIESDPTAAIGKAHLAVDHLIVGATEFPEAELIAQRARAAVRTDLSSRVPGIRMETAEAPPPESSPEPAAPKPEPEEKPENEPPKAVQALASAGKKAGAKVRKVMSKKTTRARK